MIFLSTLPHGNKIFAISEHRFHVLTRSGYEDVSFPIEKVIIGYSDVPNNEQYYIRLPNEATPYVSSNNDFAQFLKIYQNQSSA